MSADNERRTRELMIAHGWQWGDTSMPNGRAISAIMAALAEPAGSVGREAQAVEREVSNWLDNLPNAIRVCEGGGPENIAASFAVNVSRLTAAQAVDLEQFREAVENWSDQYRLRNIHLPVSARVEVVAKANRLLALIDAQHEKESAPDALVRIASELERIDGHPISGIGRSLADSLRGRAYILRTYDAQRAKGDGDA